MIGQIYSATENIVLFEIKEDRICSTPNKLISGDKFLVLGESKFFTWGAKWITGITTFGIRSIPSSYFSKTKKVFLELS